MKQLFRIILITEIVKQIPNGLISISTNPYLIEEIRKNQSDDINVTMIKLQLCKDFKSIIYSLIINCKLIQYNLRSPFYTCCFFGCEEIFNYFKAYQPDINSVDIERTLCISAAIHSGNEKIALDLLNMGAEFRLMNIFDVTPLMGACLNKLENLALSIINKLNAFNSIDIQKALSISCYNKLMKVARMLITKGTGNFI